MGTGWVLMRALEKDVPTVPKWLLDNMPEVKDLEVRPHDLTSMPPRVSSYVACR